MFFSCFYPCAWRFNSCGSDWRRGANRESAGERTWKPAVDIQETDDELILQADLPDVASSDIEVLVEDDKLIIRGRRKHQNEQTGARFNRSERNRGSFERRFTIPSAVDAANITANYKNGVLTVKLPKKEAAKPRRVAVEV
jgi:HSP20 family protein